MAKGEEYSECTHDAEAILAHHQVDKPFKRFLQAVASFSNTINELTSTNPVWAFAYHLCHLKNHYLRKI